MNKRKIRFLTKSTIVTIFYSAYFFPKNTEPIESDIIRINEPKVQENTSNLW